MRIRVLGSAAGGGFPQWNCNCPNCSGLRRGTLRARARTQSSIAVRGEELHAWVLVNASPDLLVQLQAAAALQPGRAVRDTALVAVVLVDGQIDHCTGLYMLRESRTPLAIWCTDSVFEDLTAGNPILRVLGDYCGVERHVLPLDGAQFQVAGLPGVRWQALPVASKPAPYSAHRAMPVPGDNVALVIGAASGRHAVYAPGLGALTPALWDAMQRAACVLVDGTFWSDDEMPALGLSRKRALDMGHLPQSGPGGMLEQLARLPHGVRRILIHVNNTNPILDEDSAQRAQLTRQGVEVAFDGMEIDL